MIKTFNEFINEGKTDWTDMEFVSTPEKEVADVVEQTLLSKYLIVYSDGSPEHEKLEQLSSTEEGEKVLEITGNNLTLFTVPFEFIKWESDIDDPKYVIKAEDHKKLE